MKNETRLGFDKERQQVLFPCIAVDDHGYSCLTEVGLTEAGTGERKGTPSQTVKYWHVAKYLPGHFADFAIAEDIQFMSVTSGRMELTVSNGNKQYLARGDTILLRDTHGQGHCMRVLGSEPCQVLMIAMHDLGDFVT